MQPDIQTQPRTLRRPAPQGIGHGRGFTLVELMVTISILVILTAIALPSFRSLIQSNRAKTETADFLSYLQTARVEAIREGQTVTLCGSTNGTSCNATTDYWETGWILFSDPNANQTVDAGETVLKIGQPFSSTDTLRSNASLKGVTFNREGFAQGLTGTVTFTLHTSPLNAKATRCILINVVGRAQVQTASANPTTCS